MTGKKIPRRGVTIPIVQTRTIGALTMSNSGNDWRAEALSQIGEHIRHQPEDAPDHYEVHFDGLVLEVGLSEEILHPPMPDEGVAWDDPDFPDQPTYPGD